MADKFSTAIGIHFGKRRFTDRRTDADFYVYDDENLHRTIITNKPEKALHVLNPNQLEIRHIPVDGGIIDWAQEIYIPESTLGNKRPECMLYSDTNLYYAELKTNALSTQNGNKNALKGMRQIEEFVVYLHSIEGIPFPRNEHAVVCIDKKLIRRSTEFLNNIDKFRQNTKRVNPDGSKTEGIKIEFNDEITFEE